MDVNQMWRLFIKTCCLDYLGGKQRRKINLSVQYIHAILTMKRMIMVQMIPNRAVTKKNRYIF